MTSETVDVKDELVRQFAEAIEGATLDNDIIDEDVPYIVEALVYELRCRRVVIENTP